MSAGDRNQFAACSVCDTPAPVSSETLDRRYPFVKCSVCKQLTFGLRRDFTIVTGPGPRAAGR